MERTSIVSCVLDTTDPTAELGFEAWLNNHKFFDCDHVKNRQQIFVEFDDIPASHELKFVLKHKTLDHTKLDVHGNIVSDSLLTMANLEINGIKLDKIFTEHAIYTHNFNGTTVSTQQKFYGEMGCNGTVSFKFTTPFYLWVLEHM
jgi:hypothetical protein